MVFYSYPGRFPRSWDGKLQSFVFIYNNIIGTSNVFSTFFKVNYLIFDVHLKTEVGSYSEFTWDCYKRRAKDQEIHGILHSF